jgi:hypothetical protein
MLGLPRIARGRGREIGNVPLRATVRAHARSKPEREQIKAGSRSVAFALGANCSATDARAASEQANYCLRRQQA